MHMNTLQNKWVLILTSYFSMDRTHITLRIMNFRGGRLNHNAIRAVRYPMGRKFLYVPTFT